eukprot:1130112_1
MFMILLLLVAITNAVIKISDDEIYQLTPFGYWLSDCVHSVPSSSIITNFKHHFTVNDKHTSRCKVPHNSTYIAERISTFAQQHTSIRQDNGNGWQAYVKQDCGSGVTGFNGNWVVPSVPVESSIREVLYAFTALQNIDWVPPQTDPSEPFDIIQPVLQYGYESGKGGGPFWGISSWYVTLSNDVIQSPLLPVSPGDLIYGVMQRVGNDSWYINTLDTTIGRNTSFTVSRSLLYSQPWAYVTLEVYDISSCDEFPPLGSNIPFSNLVLSNNFINTTIEWTPGRKGQNPSVCNAKIATYSSESVTISF